jgi:hypothetical protein
MFGKFILDNAQNAGWTALELHMKKSLGVPFDM